MKTNKIRFVVLAFSFSLFINLFYSNSVVLADEVEYKGGKAEEQYNKEKSQKKGVRAMEVNDRAALQNTVEDMGLFDSGVENVFSVANYDDYYDFQQNYLKTAVNKSSWLQDGDPNFGSLVETNTLNDIEARNSDDLNDIEDTYFSDSDNLHLMAKAWWRSNGLKYLYNMGLSEGNDYALIDNTIYSHNPFDVDVTMFEDVSNENGPNYNYYNYQPDNWVAQLDNSTGLYKCTIPQSMFFYSDIPIYSTYVDVEGTEDNYLGQAPYNYQNADNIYNSIGTDQTGFVSDRRLFRGLPETGTDDLLGVMQDSFVLLFSGASVDDMSLFCGYEFNNYTKAKQSNLFMQFDYTFKMSGVFMGQGVTHSFNYLDLVGYTDNYNVNNSNYLLIDVDNVLKKMRTQNSDLLNDINVIQGRKQEFYNKVMYVYKNGLSAYDLITSLVGYGLTVNTWVDNSVNKTDFSINLPILDYQLGFDASNIYRSQYGTYDQLDYMNLVVTCNLYDSRTGKISTISVTDFDLKNNTVSSQGGFEKNGENEPNWNNNYTNGNQGQSESESQNNLVNPYNPQNLNNGSFAQGGAGGQGGSATGGNANVIVNTGNGQYYVVDVPADDILKKTPNLKNIINDFKDMLDTTQEESVITLITRTYAFIPAPVWNYILYGVGIMLAIGIWRAITRRN